MSPTTPIARSKTAALARVINLIPKGYRHWTSGRTKASKALRLAHKFHQAYGIGATPAQRITRKSKGLASTALVMYWPENAEYVDWLLLATHGTGLENETLREVTARPRLTWLGYELIQYPNRGRTSWTWRRPKAEMAEHYLLLNEALAKHHYCIVADTLTRIANQPGFHGVRTQSYELCQFAQQHGYSGELPHLYYVQKVGHGERTEFTTC